MTPWSLSPPSSGTPAEELRLGRGLPLVLTAVAGTVDIIGFMSLKVFAAHITGNLVVVAALLLRGGPPSLDQALSIPIFILAVAGAWFVATISSRRGSPIARTLLLAQLCLLVCLLIFSVLTHPDMKPRGLAADIATLIAISSIACQYALVQLALPEAPTTAVMTGNLAKAVLAFLQTRSRSYGTPLFRDAERHLRRSLALIIVFFLSCVAGAGAFLWRGDWAWVLPVVLAALALAVSPRRGKPA
jgi:uncharacterized membrane protein YoaK (UPF0700 family)